MTEHEFWAEQSPVTDPEAFADRVREVPGTLSAMRAAARGLVFHYRDDGDFAANGISADRIAEIDTRYARDMLARIVSLADEPLAASRPPSHRVVGCCRGLHGAVPGDGPRARRTGTRPRRVRHLLSAWLDIDHVVAEIWDSARGSWRLVDPELAEDHVSSADGARVDPEDLTSAQFLTGAAAWRTCRSGLADAARFVVYPSLDLPLTKGWPYVRHNLIHDLAALAKHEMLLWDNWGWSDIAGEPVARSACRAGRAGNSRQRRRRAAGQGHVLLRASGPYRPLTGH